MKIREVVKEFIKNLRISVKILGRAGILYKDNNNKYLVDSEMLFGDYYDIVIYKDNIKFYNSIKNDEISEELKEEIIENICKKLKSRNLKVVFMGTDHYFV